MSHPQHQVLQQAAAWYALLRSDRVSEQDQSKWRHWHDQHPEHRHAWSLVERVGGRFGQFGEGAEKQGAMAALRAGGSAGLNRRTLLSFGGLGLASWLGWRTLDAGGPPWFADYATRTGEHRRVALAGGGQMWLNTLSAVDLRADGGIKVLSGEILLDDRPRQGSPLRIVTPLAELLSQQGVFNLRLADQRLCLDVYSGVVEIACNGQRQAIEHGQQVTVDHAGLGPLRAANEAHRAWVNGVMVADGTPLGQVVAELGRYRHGYLGCDPRVAQLPVVGTFSIRDTDRALASLASALPVRVSRVLPWWVTLEARA